MSNIKTTIFKMGDGSTYVMEESNLFEALKVLYEEHIGCEWYLSSKDFAIIVDSQKKDFEELCQVMYHATGCSSDSVVEAVYQAEEIYKKKEK